MQNNWVLLQGRLCHTPNYSATRKGLHKVAFRLAVPRPPRTTVGMPPEAAPCPPSNFTDVVLPPLGSNSDYVTVVIIGKPAWDFKQRNLQTGAPVRVQGHLRSWDTSPDDARTNETRDDAPSAEIAALDERDSGESRSAHPTSREYRIEVIAEKVVPLNDIAVAD
jgi:single-stranded DNA-binding protein